MARAIALGAGLGLMFAAASPAVVLIGTGVALAACLWPTDRNERTRP